MRTPQVVVAFAAALAAAVLALPATLLLAQEAPRPAEARRPWVFPQEARSAGRRLTIHEPVVLSHDIPGARVALRFAVAVTDPLGQTSWGVVDAGGTVRLDLDSRLVRVDGVEIARSAFPGLADADRAKVQEGLAESWPKTLLLRLELLTAGPNAATPPSEPQPRFSTQPPPIFVRRTPAVLIQTDGDPVLLDIQEIPMQYLANSATDVFRDPKSETLYLLLDGGWAQAKALAGPWKPLEGQLPLVLSQLPVTHPRGHVRRWVPGTPEFGGKGAKTAPAVKEVPEILVSDRPAELVLLKGEPLFTLVPGVKLMVVANTESDLFFHPKQGLYYLCLSGRWFTAEDLDGPWQAVVGALPEEFARIPRDHVRANVLWCVPGTPEAREACARAALEERITLNKFASVEPVMYDGKEIRTAPCEGTDAKVVTNTDDDVFVVGGVFWWCQRGTWYRSDDGRSSWQPALEVPEALRQVPESTGCWHVNFCRALGTSEEGPRYSVSGGYSGVFVFKGAPVHGTGWWKRGLLRRGNWYPYPRTYGESRWYDPVTGVFQPRTARYREDGTAVADEWSPYTASYGRVRHYADRYEQGGRRMFPFSPDQGRFDTSAGRPDIYARWLTQIVLRDGLKPEERPLGDRRGDPAPTEPRVVTDESGTAWRLGAAGTEKFDAGKWVAAEAPADVRAWLETLRRIDARPAEWKAWQAKRAAPLPVNVIK